MRLQVIRKILELYKDDLNVRTVAQGTTNYRVFDIQNAINTVKEIEKTGVLKQEIQAIKDLPAIYETPLDSIVIDNSTTNQINASFTNIRNQANTLFQALTDFMEEETEDTVLFKIPERNNLKEISDILEHLQLALEQLLVNDYINGKVEFAGFQSGSSWIKILVGSTLALSFLGGIVDLVFNFRNDQLNFEAKEKMIEDLDIQLAAKNEALDAIRKEKEVLFNSYLQSLKESADIPDDNEFNERIKYSINQLQELMDAGLEVHPSLESSPDIRQKFPDALEISKTLMLLPSAGDEEVEDEELEDEESE